MKLAGSLYTDLPTSSSPTENQRLQSPRIFKPFSDVKGIKPVTRAVGQHARFIERRGALVRDAVHRTQGQLEGEGFTVPFESMLSESVFAGERDAYRQP